MMSVKYARNDPHVPAGQVVDQEGASVVPFGCPTRGAVRRPPKFRVPRLEYTSILRGAHLRGRGRG
jgi:hypothetical protein